MAYFDKSKGRWRGQVRVEGHRYQRLCDTKKEAIKWEQTIRDFIASRRESGVSLLEAATEYLAHCEKRDLHPNTMSNKTRVLRDLLKLVGEDRMYAPLSALDVKTLLDFVYSRSTPKACNRTRKELHAFYEYCRKFLNCPGNPIVKIDRIPETRKPQRVPTEVEVAKLLAAANRFDRNLIVTFCVTGARRSEIFRLTWEDVDFEGKRIKLWSKKGRGEQVFRWVEMGETLEDVLKDQWDNRLKHSNYVFQNRDKASSRYGDRYVTRNQMLPRLCERAGIPTIRYHALRRFFTSIMADRYKQSIPVLQKLLGHSSSYTTHRYVYNVSNDTREAIKQLDGLFNGGHCGGHFSEKEGKKTKKDDKG